MEIFKSLFTPLTAPSESSNLQQQKVSETTEGDEDDMQLDISMITEQLFAMGMPWNQRTETRISRNNIKQLSLHLNKKHPRKYMIWNLSGTMYDYTFFGGQVVSIPVIQSTGSIVQDSSQLLTSQYSSSQHEFLSLKMIVDIIRSLDAWLSLSSEHFAYIHCQTGTFRTGMAISCYLRYKQNFDSIMEAYQFFASRRYPGDSNSSNIQQRDLSTKNLKPSMKRFLRYFDDLCSLDGSLPNPNPIALFACISSSPSIEIQIRDTEIKLWDSSSCVVIRDEFHAIFKTSPSQHSEITDSQKKKNPLILQKDVEIRVIANSTHIASFIFNTGFMGTGLIRVQKAEFDQGPLAKYLPDDFSLDLILDNHEGHITYEQLMDRSLSKALAQLTKYHHIRPSPSLLTNYEHQVKIKVLLRIAIQCGRDDIDEFLERCKLSFGVVENEMRSKGRKVVKTRKKAEKKVEVFYGVQPQTRQDDDSDTRSLSVEHESDMEQKNIKTSNDKHNIVLKTDQDEMQAKIDTFSEISVDETQGKFIVESVITNSSPPLSEFVVPEISGEVVIPPPPPLPLMTETGIPIAPPPPPGPGIPPPPPPPGSEPVSLTPKKRVKHRLHWDPLKQSNISNQALWNHLELEPISIDIDKFEDLFCVDPDEEKKTSESTLKKPAKQRIIDMNHARITGIVLSRFSKRLTHAEIRESIQTHSNLTLDDLTALRPILPSDQERRDIESFMNKRDFSEEELDNPEKFKIELCKEADIEFMLESYIYKLQLDPDISVLREKIDLLSSSCDDLKSDEDLKLLMAYILNIGNLMNYEYGAAKTKATGFRIQTLSKLPMVKSGDGKISLITYLVETLTLQNPSVLNLPSRFDFRNVRHLDTDILQSQIHSLRRGMDKVKNYRPAQTDTFNTFYNLCIEPFITNASIALDELDQYWNEFQRKWNETLLYFGEPPDSSMKPEELFTLFDAFFQALDDAHGKYVDMMDRKRRREAAVEIALNVPKKKGENSLAANMSVVSLRDRLLEDIKIAAARKSTDSLENVFTEIGNAVTEIGDARTELSEDVMECSECGLPISKCDCSF